MYDTKKFFVQIPRDGAVVFFTSTENNHPSSCYEISEECFNRARSPLTGENIYRVYDGLPDCKVPKISWIDRIIALIHKLF